MFTWNHLLFEHDGNSSDSQTCGVCKEKVREERKKGTEKERRTEREEEKEATKCIWFNIDFVITRADVYCVVRIVLDVVSLGCRCFVQKRDALFS